MRQHKEYLNAMCAIENLSVKEIMAITGKSQPQVYKWMNISKDDCFPAIESLGKILFRLGISFDDFINCRHPIYDDFGKKRSARIYYQYFCGAHDNINIYIDSCILEHPKAEAVLMAYILDRKSVMTMVNDYVNGSNIDTHRFDLLCKALRPCFVSEVIGEADLSVEHLNSYSLQHYKSGVEIIKEIEEDNADEEEPCEMPMHKIYFPYANRVILLAAENNSKILDIYLNIADDEEKRLLLSCYLDIYSQNCGYDKKNKILKKLIENNCKFYDDRKNTATERYCELLRKMLQIENPS